MNNLFIYLQYYEGTYEDAIGTYMFFEKDTNPVVDDPIFDKIPNVKYFTKAKKVLKMKRVFVKPRLEVLGDSNNPSCTPNMETIQDAGIPPKYQEEALSMWEQMRNERLEALNEYLERQKRREKMRSEGIEPDSESDDDSPFAMYKPDTVESMVTTTESMKADEVTAESENCQETFTIIDPGPSTSKDSVPWSSPAANSTVKFHDNVDTIKRRKRRKEQNQSECQESDDIPVQKSNLIDVISDIAPTNTKTMDIDQRQEDIAVVIDKQSADLMNLEIENMNISVVEQLPSQEKKVEKQRKREAKMREISDRLKKAANNIKTKDQ